MPSIRCRRIALALLSFLLATTPLPSLTDAAEPARYGGTLLAVIGADPPSLDPHEESTFATMQLVAPLYSTLLQFDPYESPKIMGDAATEWTISDDGLTYTFKIHKGIKFHDGSVMTAADVKATYDKIILPPAGVRTAEPLPESEVAGRVAHGIDGAADMTAIEKQANAQSQPDRKLTIAFDASIAFVFSDRGQARCGSVDGLAPTRRGGRHDRVAGAPKAPDRESVEADLHGQPG